MAKEESHPRVKDGVTNSLGGVNSSIESDVLNNNQLSFAVNVALRGGYPSTRPGFTPWTSSLDFSGDTSIQDWFNTKVFQFGSTFTPQAANAHTLIVVSIGGRIFTIDPFRNFLVREITPSRSTALSQDSISPGIGLTVTISVTDASAMIVGFPATIGDGKYVITNTANNLVTFTNVNATPGVALLTGIPVQFLDSNPSILPMTFYEKVEGNLIIQDGQSATIISNGFSSRRRALDEVPVGTAMKYHQGRLHVAVFGNQLAIGDIASTNNVNTALKFTEANFATGGGNFRVGGEITAIVEMSSLDASLGQGPLQVITQDDFNSFNLPAQRDTWNTLTYPFQTISVKNFGALGQYGTVIVNGDCFYRSKDGLRSFIMARRQFGGWGNTPVSNELSRVLDGEVSDLTRFSSCVLFDNRLLFTCKAHRLTYGAYFDMIGSLDFDPITSISGNSPPIYDGVWTGIHPYQLLTGDFDGITRCFAFTNETTGLGLWEISKNLPFDGDGGRIRSWVEYPAFKFKDPFDLKKLQSCKVFVSDIIGSVDYTLRFKVDDAACWMEWGKRNRCTTVNTCKTGSCYTLQTFKSGYKPHMGFAQPPDTCEEFENKNARFGYQWQLRLEWEGHSTVKRLIATADSKHDQVIGNEDADDD